MLLFKTLKRRTVQRSLGLLFYQGKDTKAWDQSDFKGSAMGTCGINPAAQAFAACISAKLLDCPGTVPTATCGVVCSIHPPRGHKQQILLPSLWCSLCQDTEHTSHESVVTSPRLPSLWHSQRTPAGQNRHREMPLGHYPVGQWAVAAFMTPRQ